MDKRPVFGVKPPRADRQSPAPITDEEAFRAADQAYTEPRMGGTPFKDVPDGEEVKVGGREFVKVETVESRASGLVSYLLKDEKTGTGVVAFRGTDSFSVFDPDVIADASIALRMLPAQAQQADAVFKSFRAKHPELTQWTVTGHSLGGMLSQYVLLRNGRHVGKGFNFSGPNIYPALSAKERALAARFGGRMVNFGNSADPIYKYWRSGGRTQIGSVFYIDAGEGGGFLGHEHNGQFQFGDAGGMRRGAGGGNPLTWLLGLATNPVFGFDRGLDIAQAVVGVNADRLDDVMSSQAELPECLWEILDSNAEVVELMRERFDSVRRSALETPNIRPEDVDAVIAEFGLAPEKNVDEGLVDRVSQDVGRRLEDNERLVAAMAEVMVSKFDGDRADAHGFKE